MLRRTWDDCMVIDGRAACTGAVDGLRPCCDGTINGPASFDQASGGELASQPSMNLAL